MKYPLLALLAVSTALLLFEGCPNPNDSGGAGANFDPAQYYTKSDINSYLGAALPTYANSNNVTATLSSGNTSYANGTSITGSLPSGAWQVLVKVKNNTGAVATLFLGDSPTHQDSWTLPLTSNDSLLLYHLRPNGTALSSFPNWWATSTGSVNITVTGLFYFFDPVTGRP